MILKIYMTRMNFMLTNYSEATVIDLLNVTKNRGAREANLTQKTNILNEIFIYFKDVLMMRLCIFSILQEKKNALQRITYSTNSLTHSRRMDNCLPRRSLFSQEFKNRSI